MIIEELKVIQAELKLTDGGFATKLSLDRARWNKLKNGHDEPTADELRRFIGAYPQRVGTVALRQFLGPNYRAVSLAILQEVKDEAAKRDPDEVREVFHLPDGPLEKVGA